MPRVGATVLALACLAAPAVAQAPSCTASGHAPLRSAAEVQAAVAERRCPPGSLLDVAMTVAGQAILLQTSGICRPDSVRTGGQLDTPPGSPRGLRFRCVIA